MDKPITKEQVKFMQQEFDKRDKVIEQCATTTNGIFKASENVQAIGSNDFNFTIDIDSEKVTNQNQSGRCWMFACLNIIRFNMEQQYNVENFELSQNYTYFWDKLEKANYFYHNIIETGKEPISNRTVQYLLNSPQQDGGDWELIVSLIQKYGVVPTSAMNEVSASINSAELNTMMNRKLRTDALELRQMIEQDATDIELASKIDEYLVEVYRMLCISLGTPPTSFDFSFRTKDNEFEAFEQVTPLEMYEKYIDMDISDYVGVINVPTKEMPFNQTFEVAYSGNMVDGLPNLYLNIEMEELKNMTMTQLKAGEPVWFGCDVLKQFDRQKGVMSHDLYKLEELFDVEFPMTKGERFTSRDSLPTHAMVIAGVNIVDDKPTKWKVENSWGHKIGDKGYFVMDDKWMDEFVFEVAIKKEYLSKEQLACLNQKPIELGFWNPMNPIA